MKRRKKIQWGFLMANQGAQKKKENKRASGGFAGQRKKEVGATLKTHALGPGH